MAVDSLLLEPGGAFEHLLGGLDGRVRGAEFERLCRWYLLNAPEYRDLVRHVWLWHDWPDRWGADAGIDLVVEPVAGKLWAVQAKCYAPSYYIKKSDVDSFLTESARPAFGQRLLMATTDRIGATARRTIDAQEKPVVRLLRSHLESADVAWPETLNSTLPVVIALKTPRPHQEVALEAVCSGLAEDGRGQLVMACGTGKTLVGLWVSERLSRSTLVLMPSLSLLSQTLHAWTASASEPFRYLAVCSDATVTKADGEDAVVVSTSELGVPVTTDVADVASFLAEDGNRVVFCTYQSAAQVALAQTMVDAPFDLLVADEAHRCAGPASGVFALALDEQQLRARRRLFMTATPRYFTGRLQQAAQANDFAVASMDDEERFGPVLHRLTFGDAIQRELLSDYQVVVVAVDDEGRARLAERAALVTTDGETTTDARELASQAGLLRAMRRFDLRRVVTFHSRIRSARAFSRSLPLVLDLLRPAEAPSGLLVTDFVSARMTTSERGQRLRRLERLGEGERAVLSNARCLTEGVDVPAIDGIAFIDPRRSQVDIIQAVGRAIRRSQTKTLGTIVLPVFVDETKTPEEALADSAFEPVWSILQALRAHDDDLAEQLDGLRRNLGRHGRPAERPTKIKLDLPQRVGQDFIDAFDALLVERTTATWEFWLGLLERYAIREGHARPPSGSPVGHIEDGHKLGLWVYAQRQQYRKGQLSQRRQQLLQALPDWTWKPFTSRWDESYIALERYTAREGNALVPTSHVEDGVPLGRWVAAQRDQRRSGKLAAGRIARLEALAQWSWNRVDEAWESAFSRLEQFVAREGHAHVPTQLRADGFALGSWVADQRKAQRRGKLDPSREARLSALPGWTWQASPTQRTRSSWEDAFVILETFTAREGLARPNIRHIEADFALGDWSVRQRRAHKAGQLEPERCGLLESLPGWTWDHAATVWNESFSLLSAYVEREGDARVPQSHLERGERLGSWVGTQRTRHKGKLLSADRVRRLAALPGWTWGNQTQDANWSDAYQALLRFAARESHARVPAAHLEDGFRLGQWVGTQRRLQREHALSRERRDLLERTPDWAWSARAA